jgi:hypothetical protein
MIAFGTFSEPNIKGFSGLAISAFSAAISSIVSPRYS